MGVQAFGVRTGLPTPNAERRMPMKTKHIPQRSCVACRTVRDKNDLVRLVRTPEGEIVVDPTGKLSGRGAYLCPRPDCLRAAQKRKSLDRALRMSLPAEAWARLEPSILERSVVSDEQLAVSD